MTTVSFTCTTKDLGPMGTASFRVGYVEASGRDVWRSVRLTNNAAEFAFPASATKFVLKCLMSGQAGGVVELEMKVGSKALKPGFKQEVGDNESGKALIFFQEQTL
jgi:hypothetical protein